MNAPLSPPSSPLAATGAAALDRSDSDVVLIVDAAPDMDYRDVGCACGSEGDLEDPYRCAPAPDFEPDSLARWFGRERLRQDVRHEERDVRFVVAHGELVATHGEAALQRAAQALPDIVLLDVMMPGMDGFELRDRVTKALPALPVFLITGRHEMADADRTQSVSECF